MRKIIIFVVIVTIGIIGVATWSFARPTDKGEAVSSNSNLPSNPQLNGFAQCLAKKKVVMYGASWCPHCQRQKALFGSAFKYVSYVECPDNPKVCLDKGIKGYPTWIFPNGHRFEGEQSLEKLSKESSCSLPK
jgi:thiol-disulfide isomerase/thioredoxin